MPKNFIYVVSAYGAIWVALIVYLLMLGGRLTRAEQQLSLLKKK